MISLSGLKASFIGGFFLFACAVYLVLYTPNTQLKHDVYDLEVVDYMTAEEILVQLENDQVIRNFQLFRAACRLLDYSGLVPPGLYQIRNGWNNQTLIAHLKSEPRPSSMVIIKPYQKRRNTLQSLCKTLDIKFTALRAWMEDTLYLKQWGAFDDENVYCILIPDTLLIYQDSRAKEVADRLFRNYDAFWNTDRLEKAAQLGLTNQEAGILASIVYAETKQLKEMPLVAGLYLNRLEKDMRLQADPTIVFAHGKPLTRVLNKHKKIRSAYNTYRMKGLPPGPVFSATSIAIEAVLNPGEHDYLYFCARNDFSGLHHFSRTLDEHLQIARSYQKELNRRRIGYRGS